VSAAAGAVLAAACAQPRPPAAAPLGAPATYVDSIPGTLVTFEVVRVPGGTVTIEDATGARIVDVAPFYIGRTEVTWDMYDVFALRLDASEAMSREADAVARPSEPYGAPDQGWGRAGHPAISITREAAAAFCDWLTERTGHRYRLPTDAEWQRAADLAARSATAATLPLAAAVLDRVAWHRGNAGARTHEVATREPDALGLFDLFGNAAEWVTSDDGARIVRGGSFRDAATAVGPRARAVQTSAWNERDPQLPQSRWWLSDAPFVGFRIVREP
jgi:formylglycine-generating enzyme required for sulfatase activity